MQQELGLSEKGTVGAILENIHRDSRSTTEQGRWFERLFAQVALHAAPELDVEGIWSWQAWPDREQTTGLDGQDIGIDLVARLRNGTLVAIQCKCYEPGRKVGARDIDAAGSGTRHRETRRSRERD